MEFPIPAWLSASCCRMLEALVCELGDAICQQYRRNLAAQVRAGVSESAQRPWRALEATVDQFADRLAARPDLGRSWGEEVCGGRGEPSRYLGDAKAVLTLNRSLESGVQYEFGGNLRNHDHFGVADDPT